MKNGAAPSARLSALQARASTYSTTWLSALGQELIDVVPFDPSLPYTDRWAIPGAPAGGSRLNQGCPSGYFAQLVGAGQPGAMRVTIPGVVRDEWVRCRLATTTTPATIMDETGITFDEALNVYTGAVRDTLRQAGEALPKLLSWTPWIVGGVAVIVGGIVLLRVLR